MSNWLTNFRKRRWQPPRYVELSVDGGKTKGAAAAGAELPSTPPHFDVRAFIDFSC